MVKPAQRNIQMLSQSDGRVGRKRETREAKTVDCALVEVTLRQELGEGTRGEPMSAVSREARVGNRDRNCDDGFHCIRHPSSAFSSPAGPQYPPRQPCGVPARSTRLFESSPWPSEATDHRMRQSPVP